MDKDTVKGILARWSPPLAPSQMEEIAEAILSELNKTEPLKSEPKKKSKSSRMTRRRG